MAATVAADACDAPVEGCPVGGGGGGVVGDGRIAVVPGRHRIRSVTKRPPAGASGGASTGRAAPDGPPASRMARISRNSCAGSCVNPAKLRAAWDSAGAEDEPRTPPAMSLKTVNLPAAHAFRVSVPPKAALRQPHLSLARPPLEL